ncbi:uncharacterized protein LOC130795264 isoform X1 [Actinidia eriantha]|uniref:uncharacterized protein LOC130795264 isoform X1 n=2 Tax=Actinidia eriantha TaxID=165200 RepID=UPI00258871A7|nr:uncharacterized protein LOC130795264 isoform X1 [Actinidia eriantha]
MTRSSRHKSHKQSKHSSRDAKEPSDLEEDVKMKDRNVKEEGSVRVSRDSGSSEKRKLSLGKDSSAHGNGDASEEYVASKRRKEKAEDRWNGTEKEMTGESSKIDVDKSSKSTAVVDSKCKSSRRHDGGSGKEENVDSIVEKEESKSSGRVESRRKSEKDSGRKEVQQYKDPSEWKDKECGSEKERKVQGNKGETEARAIGSEVTKKQGSHSVDFAEEKQGKRGRENTDIQDELRNHELEKELEKRMRRRRDGSNDKDKYQVKESEDRRLSSKGERAVDGRSKDEKRKDGSYGDKHGEDGDRDKRNKDDKDLEDVERDSRHRDLRYREDGDRDNRHRDDKYQEDGERDNRLRDVKYREDGDRDNRHRDNKYHEDDRNNRHRDDKYHEAGYRDKRHRNDKYREDGDRDDQHRDDKYREDADRDDRHRDHWYLEDGSRDSRYREEKNWEDVGRDGRHRDGKQRDDSDKDKRLRDGKHRDEHSRERTSDKSDSKRMRDKSNAADHYRKSTNRDGSPIYDDWSTRYKDDKGRRRTSDKDDHGDIKFRSTNEQHSDAAKKSMSSNRVESVSDRGRSNSHADVEATPNHSRRRSSPGFSSHAAKDHYRPSKHEESKHRDNAHEERVQRNVTPSKECTGVTEKTSLSQSIEKSLQKYDSHLSALSAERRPKADAHTSPLHMVDKSPSSTSTDRRHLNRSDVRRSLDVEDSGQRRGGSKDTKDYSGKEGRGSRELATEILPGDELSQADGDNISISSPFGRTSHLSSSSRSLLPPPAPFRIAADNHGSLEDDNRGKPSNRHRRIGDPNTVRVQGNPWRGVPNWPSPVSNGFLPFQHGPPPVGFHPVMMHQFPAPPMFSVRPPMELNQSGVPYHVPDGNRFSGQGRTRGWPNPMDDSCPPPIHGWDANNAVFGDESNIYGRLDWDHNRTLTNDRVWEASGDTWKSQNSGVSAESPSAPQKEDYSARGPADELCTDQSVLQAQNDQKQPIVLTESIDTDQSSDTHERNTLEDPKTISKMPNLSRKDDTCLAHVYLSVLDISVDLTQPELYSQFTGLMSLDQNTNLEEDDSKFLLVEETLDATMKIPNKSSSASLFSTLNDSVLQKAMSVYKKLREEVGVIKGNEIPFCNVESLESAPTLDQEDAGSDDDKPRDVVPTCDEQEAECVVSAVNEVKGEDPPAIAHEKIDEPALSDSLEKPEESIPALNEVKMELDLVPKQEALDSIVEDKSSNLENEEQSQLSSPGEAEEVSRVNNEGYNLNDIDTKCGPVLFSDVPSEAAMPESIESGLVNLSRIHQSPESTH